MYFQREIVGVLCFWSKILEQDSLFLEQILEQIPRRLAASKDSFSSDFTLGIVAFRIEIPLQLATSWIKS